MTDEAEIYDPLRRKMVARTPEEEVRQAVIAWLRDVKGIPETRMESEWGFTYNRRRYRADIVAFDRELRPQLLVECKAPGVRIDEKVIEQVVRYARVLPVRHIMVTNGTVTHLLARNEADGSYAFLAEIPEKLG
jgi:hypothetical protein